MSDTTIQLNPGVGGDQVDAELVSVGPSVKRQRAEIGGAALSEIARVTNINPSGTEYGLVVRTLTTPLNTTQVTDNTGTAAKVINNPPGGTDYGLVVRPVPDVAFRTQIGGPVTGVLATVDNTTPGSSEYGLTVRQVPDTANRIQIGGATGVALASVMNTVPTGTEYALAVRQVPNTSDRTQIGGATTAQLATVGNVAPAMTDYGLTVRPVPMTASTCTQTSVNASLTSTSLLAANAARKGFSISNDAAGGVGARLYLRMDASAVTSTNWVEYLDPGETYTDDFQYTGAVQGIWVAATGAARIGEWT